MKSFTAIAAIAGVAAAQNLGSCAQQCVNNMATIAESQFQCSTSDQNCFCTKSNWAYGIRDCTRQACGEAESSAAVAYAAALCSNFGGASAPPAAVPILTGAPASASATSVVASITGPLGSAGQSAVTTIPLVGTVTDSAGSAVPTTTGFSTVFGSLTGSVASEASGIGASASSVASGIVGSASSAAASAASSASGVLSSITGSATSRLNSATSAAGSAAASATSAGGAASMPTGLPLLAGAGMFAAYFL